MATANKKSSTAKVASAAPSGKINFHPIQKDVMNAQVKEFA